MSLRQDISKKAIEYLEVKKYDFERELMGNNEWFITVDVIEMLSLTQELCDYLMEHPDITIRVIEKTASEVLEKEDKGEIKVKLCNLPDAYDIQLNRFRKEVVGTLVRFRGMIKRKTEPFIKTRGLYFICSNPSCQFSEHPIYEEQEDTIKRLKSCPKCKSQVQETGEDLVDSQIYEIEEMSEDLPNPTQQPISKVVEVNEYLTNPHINDKLSVGSKVFITGIVRSKKKKSQNKERAVSDYYIEATNIDLEEETLYDIEVTEKEREQIKELLQDEEIKNKIISSFGKELRGMDMIKEGVILSVLGGSEYSESRDKIHIHIVGEPSTGKSQLLGHLKNLLPRTKYVSGEGSSGTGLTASAVKDENSGGWNAEAGAIVQANKGQLLIDEMDKISRTEQSKLNTALESGNVVLDKANVSVNLKSDTTVVSASNPKYGRFDKSRDFIDQVEINPVLRTRFDLIYFLLDIEEESEEELVQSLMGGEESEEIIDEDLLRKYLIEAKKLKPEVTKESMQIITEYYNRMRKNQENSDKINITKRQLLGLKRLAEAHAKLHFREEVTEEDSNRAIQLMTYCHGYISPQEQVTGVSFEKMNKRKALELVIESMRGREFTIDEVKEKMGEKVSERDMEELIERMKGEAYLFEPRKNIYKLL